MAFDTQRAVVATGDGIVARFPGVLCVARCPDPGPVRHLLALCADAAGPDPGRDLARRFATWLIGPDAPGDRLAFGTLAAAGDHLAVFLVGPVEAWVDGPGGTTLSGAHAAIGTDRLLPRPSAPVVLTVGESVLPPDAADVHDLRAGVVPGAGAVLHPSHGDVRPAWADDTRERAAAAAPPDAHAEPPAGEPADPPSGGAGHDWFAARPEPPPPLGPWDTPLWPGPSNGAATRVNGRRSTVVVPAAAPGPWPSGRHAIIDPAPEGTEQSATGPVEEVDGAEEAARAGSDADLPGDGPSPSDVDPAGAAGHRSADPAETAGHRQADAVTVSGPIPPPPVTDPVAEAPAEEAPPEATATEAAASEPAADAGGRSRAPSPVPRSSPTTPAAGTVSAGATEASGYLCAQGHLSDPRAPFCGLCGAVVDDRAGGLVTGPRPALGRLVFDDGATYPVAAGLLVGRMPEADDRVVGGDMLPVIVEDPTGSVSRVHAQIHVSGWDVMLHDAGSRNGTFVAGPEENGWSPLPPQRGRRLLPGTRVRLGGRTFTYESASGLR